MRRLGKFSLNEVIFEWMKICSRVLEHTTTIPPPFFWIQRSLGSNFVLFLAEWWGYRINSLGSLQRQKSIIFRYKSFDVLIFLAKLPFHNYFSFLLPTHDTESLGTYKPFFPITIFSLFLFGPVPLQYINMHFE